MRIQRILAGHYVEKNREVAGLPGHGAGVIERPGEDRDACLTDASIGRLDARYAVCGRRRADRSTRVATSCSEAEARSNRSTRTTARARRNMVLIPRILGRTGVETKGEFVGRDFAEDYCTCFAKLADDRAVLSGNVTFPNLRASGRFYTFCVVYVLDRDRDAMKGAAILACSDLLFSLCG